MIVQLHVQCVSYRGSSCPGVWDLDGPHPSLPSPRQPPPPPPLRLVAYWKALEDTVVFARALPPSHGPPHSLARPPPSQPSIPGRHLMLDPEPFPPSHSAMGGRGQAQREVARLNGDPERFNLFQTAEPQYVIDVSESFRHITSLDSPAGSNQTLLKLKHLAARPRRRVVTRRRPPPPHQQVGLAFWWGKGAPASPRLRSGA